MKSTTPQCWNKRQWESEQSALDHMQTRESIKRGVVASEMRVDQCELCGKFHVTKK
jgi:hypothetical protein